MAGLCSSSHGSCAMCRLPSFCTHEIDSTPPATITGTRSTMTRCAAMAMVCNPDEQKRFTVVPAVVTGSPARRAIWRAMLPPVVPSGSAQPMMTSSTSPGSIFARSTAARTAWPPSVAPWVMFRAPRHDFARPVRAVETMTASVMDCSSSCVEGLALGRKALQERRGLPELGLGVRVLREPIDGAHDVEEADGVRMEHRPAAEWREAISRQIHQVDIGGALGDPLLEDERAFVDQREDAALHDLLVADLAARNAGFPGIGDDQLVHDRIGNRVAFSRLISIPTSRGLLSKAPHLAQSIRDDLSLAAWLLGVAALADQPAHVAARKVRHAKRAHRHPEAFHRAVDLRGQRAFLEEELGLPRVLVEHAVADEAVADAGDDARLLDLLRQRHRAREHVLGGGLAAHDLEQLHHVRGAEEVRADDVLRPPGEARDLIDVERGGIGGEDCSRLHHLVELLEDRLLHRQILEDRFDDDVGLREVFVAERRPDEAHPLLDLR